MATVLETSRPTLRVPITPFKNEPLTDFTNPENARKMKEALVRVKAELGREYDMVIGDKLIKTQICFSGSDLEKSRDRGGPQRSGHRGHEGI